MFPILESGVRVRLLQTKDADPLRKLVEQSPNTLKPEEIPARVASVMKFDDEIYIVAEKGTELLGCVGIITYMALQQGPIALVSNMIVDQNYRRQGIGTALMEGILAIARRNKVRYLHLFTDDPEARMFFEKIGLEVREGHPMIIPFL